MIKIARDWGVELMGWGSSHEYQNRRW